MKPDHICDLVIVGSGASGLTAAVTAAHLGLDVVVLEKHHQIGGTSAWSGGWLWVPRNPLAIRGGIKEDADAPRRYLRAELGSAYRDDLVDAFLEQAPRMVSFLIENTAMAFVDGNVIPDFHDTSDGAGKGGRSVCAAPFDGRKLGARLKDMRAPLDLVSPFGMGIAAGADLRHFLNATRKWPAFLHVTKRIIRHWLDRLIHERGQHLVAGNALVARLLKSADDLGVTILAEHSADELIREGERIIGVLANGTRFLARRGVVMASGGFPHDGKRQAVLFPENAAENSHFSAAPRENTGDGLRLAERAGGTITRNFRNAGAWAPVSLVPDGRGGYGHFPHLIERAKPGLIMVLKNGKRFTNEANSYHDVMQALFAATPSHEMPECWLICDHAFQRRYGLGRARPRPFPIRPWLANGYLQRGDTLLKLAQQTGIDSDGLHNTLTAYNAAASMGNDFEFGRGNTSYNRIQGDPEQPYNPCNRAVGPGPFYALRIVPGSLGTFAGVKTDASARVLSENSAPIPGLYAIGNDMASMMAGNYPAGGITLGPGMTFAYIAAHHASGVPLENNRS